MKELLEGKQFWVMVSQGDRWFWRMTAQEQSRLLECLARYGVRSERTYYLAQDILKAQYNRKQLEGAQISLILWAYTKSGLLHKYKGLHTFLAKKAEDGPLQLKRQWKDPKFITQAIWAIASPNFTAPALATQLSVAALKMKDKWMSAPLPRITIAAQSFNKSNVCSEELMQVFRDAAISKMVDADAIQLGQLASAFKVSRRRVVDDEFDTVFINRVLKVSDTLTAVELFQVTSYLASRHKLKGHVQQVLSDHTESVLDTIYDNHALVKLVKAHAVSGNPNHKLFRKALNVSLPYLPFFEPKELSEFMESLLISKAPVTKAFPKIASVMRSQVKECAVKGEAYDLYALAKALSVLVLTENVEYDKLFGAAAKSLELTLSNKPDSLDATEIHNVGRLNSVFVAGGKAKEYEDVLKNAMAHPSIAGADSSILYRSALCMKAEGIELAARTPSLTPASIQAAKSQKNGAMNVSEYLKAKGKDATLFAEGPDGNLIDVSLPNKVAVLVASHNITNGEFDLGTMVKQRHLNLSGYKVVVLDGNNWKHESDGESLIESINQLSNKK